MVECHRLASGVLRSAVHNRLIQFNPCEEVRIPKRRKTDKHDRILSREDVLRRLLPAVPDFYRGAVATAAGTGLRWGEVAGLCSDAIDLENGMLTVIRTVVEVGGHTSFKPYPKSGAGRRIVPLPPWLVEVVCAHVRQWPPVDGGPVFANMAGKPLRRTLFRSLVWKPSLVRAGLLGSITALRSGGFAGEWSDASGVRHSKEFATEKEAVAEVARLASGGPTFHDLRHSYATWLVDDGVPVNMVQRVMGPRAIIDNAGPVHPMH